MHTGKRDKAPLVTDLLMVSRYGQRRDLGSSPRAVRRTRRWPKSSSLSSSSASSSSFFTATCNFCCAWLWDVVACFASPTSSSALIVFARFVARSPVSDGSSATSSSFFGVFLSLISAQTQPFCVSLSVFLLQMWKNRKNAHQLSSDSFAETLLVMSSKGSGDGGVGGKVLGAEQSQARAHRGSGEEGKGEQHRAGVCGKLQRVRQFAHVDGNWPTFVCLKCESMMNATWCCAEPDLQGFCRSA